jgi:hypothetical protein
VQKIIDRVQKLLALAGNNANENEALAALEKAHAILAEHNMTMAEIGDRPETQSADQQRDSLNTDTNMPERYNKWVWNAVAGANSCLMFSFRPNPKKYRTIYTMVGRRVNIVVATQMALYLCQTMKRLAAAHCKEAGRSDFNYKNAYLTGMALRLVQRINEMKAVQGNALVLWSGEEAKANAAHVADSMGVKLKDSKAVTHIRYNTEAMHAGSRDAEKVSLSQQVAGRGPQAAIA